MPTSLASTINETLEALLVGGLVTAAYVDLMSDTMLQVI